MPDRDARSFAARLKRERIAAAMTQETLASRSGVSVRAISDLERGVSGMPRVDTMMLLADALGLEGQQRREFFSRGQQGAGLASAPPRFRPPRRLAPIVGREAETAAALDMLTAGACDLVTLIGPGGVGKTRLAIHVAALAADGDAFPGGVAFVEAAAARDHVRVLDAVAAAIGIRDAGESGLPGAIAAALGAAPSLLVLDNMEQVTEAGPAVRELLDAAPALRVLATSRTALRVSGEHRIPVDPLPVPGEEARAEEIAGSPSVRLYLERAEAVAPGQDRSGRALADVAAVCRRLAGLPLAIELAASRANVLDPADLLPELDRLLPVLTGGPADAPDRHRTLRAAIEWDHRLLTADQRLAFERLAVFRGGFTLPAAAEVLAASSGGRIGHQETLDLVGALVDRSIVRRSDAPAPARRFLIPDPLVEFALERLAERGELEDALDRHAEWAVGFAEPLGARSHSGEDSRVSDLLESEIDNLRAALARAADTGNALLGARLVAALWFFWFTRGSLRDGVAWTARVLALPAPAPADGADAAWAWARAQGVGAFLHSLAGRQEPAEAWAASALALADRDGDQRNCAFVSFMASFVRGMAGADDEAIELAEEGLACAERAADRQLTALCANRLGVALVSSGATAEAIPRYRQALAIWRDEGFIWGIGTANENLGGAHKALGDWPRAIEHYRAVLRLPGDQRDVWGIVNLLFVLAEVQARSGHAAQAARLLGVAGKLQEQSGIDLQSHDLANREQAAALVAAALSPEDAEAYRAEGAAMTFDEMLTMALAVEAPG